MVIDVDELRKDLINDSIGAFFGGGYGHASDEEVVEIALQKGVDLSRYEVNE